MSILSETHCHCMSIDALLCLRSLFLFYEDMYSVEMSENKIKKYRRLDLR